MSEAPVLHSTESMEFQLEIPARILEALPSSLRDDDAAIEPYLLRALEIGLQALAEAGVSLDTGAVQRAFGQFEAGVERMHNELKEVLRKDLTDDDSRLARKLAEYLEDEGKLGRMLSDLHQDLGDPKRAHSIPGRVDKLLQDCFTAADSPFRQALNAENEHSPLRPFVKGMREGMDELAERLQRHQAEIDTTLKERFESVFKVLGVAEQRDEAEAAGTRKGFSFEDLVEDVLRECTKRNHDGVDGVGPRSRRAPSHPWRRQGKARGVGRWPGQNRPWL